MPKCQLVICYLYFTNLFSLSCYVVCRLLKRKPNIKYFKNKLDQGCICGQMQNVSAGKGKSSYYSAMPRARGLKFYYVIADPKVGE